MDIMSEDMLISLSEVDYKDAFFYIPQKPEGGDSYGAFKEDRNWYSDDDTNVCYLWPFLGFMPLLDCCSFGNSRNDLFVWKDNYRKDKIII